MSRNDLDELARKADANVLHEVTWRTTSDTCPQCLDKDFSDSCPLGWIFSETDMLCIAPDSYHGLCGRTINALGSTVVDKKEIELSCSVCWPCVAENETDGTSCVRDWAAECPNGYEPADIEWHAYRASTGTRCEVTPTYEGTCEPEAEFAGLQEKRTFSRRCATSWPCVDDCESHHGTSVCPVSWTHIGEGVCVAPDHYKKTGCQLIKKFSGWSSKMKLQFATQCNVRWGCRINDSSEQPLRHDATCHEVDLSSCPAEWYKDGMLCVPPASTNGLCGSVIDFRGWTDAEKLYWSSDCMNVNWPCRAQLDHNASSTRGTLHLLL